MYGSHTFVLVLNIAKIYKRMIDSYDDGGNNDIDNNDSYDDNDGNNYY